MQIEIGPTPFFQERLVPAGCRLAGWSALVRAFHIPAPVRRPACVSNQHVKGSRVDGEWSVFDQRYWPGDTFAGHLAFALRHEDLDLLIFKRLCDRAPAEAFTEMAQASPAGAPARRAWYLYELLTGRRLPIDDSSTSLGAIDLLDKDRYFTAAPRMSRRHRVRDNLLGTGAFCPVIRRTPALAEYLGLDLSARARETVGRTTAHLVARAAGFLLLADSRASFAIEGERPPTNRVERWGRAVLQAGRNPLTLDEILRLERVLIEDTRFVHPGLRPDGVFLGERGPDGEPLPEFMGARPEDLASLLTGLLDANNRMREDGLDAVLKAAATAFGFVYIHPFQDGNGRMHRCLVHHVLAERGYTPPGMVFPVSSVMLDRIDDYRRTFQEHSRPLMPYIEWRPTSEQNIEVLNDTADLYRYFDATVAAEFLYSCVRRTVEEDLPREIDYLRRHDEAMRRIMEVIDLPDRVAENLIRFIRQNDGVLSRKRREGEFQRLRDDEAAAIEAIVNQAFASLISDKQA